MYGLVDAERRVRVASSEQASESSGPSTGAEPLAEKPKLTDMTFKAALDKVFNAENPSDRGPSLLLAWLRTSDECEAQHAWGLVNAVLALGSVSNPRARTIFERVVDFFLR
eukprot:3034394-Lingulodinium_polyedra.AAC.1